mgnify:CR=1 FL=1|jgi:hypothetical protein
MVLFIINVLFYNHKNLSLIYYIKLKYKNKMNTFRENFMILPALSLYYLITEHIFSCNRAEGRSMEPTI